MVNWPFDLEKPILGLHALRRRWVLNEHFSGWCQQIPAGDILKCPKERRCYRGRQMDIICLCLLCGHVDWTPISGRLINGILMVSIRSTWSNTRCNLTHAHTRCHCCLLGWSTHQTVGTTAGSFPWCFALRLVHACRGLTSSLVATADDTSDKDGPKGRGVSHRMRSDTFLGRFFQQNITAELKSPQKDREFPSEMWELCISLQGRQKEAWLRWSDVRISQNHGPSSPVPEHYSPSSIVIDHH